MNTPRTQWGYSLVEMLIAIIVGGVVLAAMMGVTVQQQRFYLFTGDVARTEGTLGGLESVLGPDLLALNPASGDVTFADEDSIAMRVFRGVYYVCDKKVTTDVLLTVRSLTGGPPLQSDSARIYSRGTRSIISDDHWEPIEITSVQSGTCPDGSDARTAVVKGLAGIMSEIPIGAPVRVFRHASFWLAVRSGEWLLLTDGVTGMSSVVTAPLTPSDSSAASTLQFSYFDASGDPTTMLAEIAQVGIDASAIGDVPMKRTGDPHRAARTVLFKLRNAN